LAINTLTIDLETTIRNTVGKNKASPFCSENKVILTGYKYSGHDSEVFNGLLFYYTGEDVDLIVGQNFKFDIQYIRRDAPNTYELFIKKDWWDTSVAEYILTAQQKKYPSLDYLAERYGGTLKDDKIKEYWEQGVDTSDIPIDLLEEYCKHDVINTELVAHKQIELAKKRGMYDLVVLMSNATKVYADMEYNGLHIDVSRLDEIQKQLEGERNKIQFTLTGIVRAAYPDIPPEAWNLNSNQQLSALIFGGDIKWSFCRVVGQKEVEREIDRIPQGVWKSGKNKGETRYKVIKAKVPSDIKERIEGSKRVNLCKAVGIKEWENNNGYNTSDSTLQTLLNAYIRPEAKEFMTSILELRRLNKLISTYCEQIRGLIFPDGRVHHNLNSVATDTGRLSSTNPNMQNIPSGMIKSMFTSRFGKDGCLVQVDYSQLEVVWQAFVSGDEAMKQGIRDGVDFHCMRLAKKEGMDYDKVVQLCKVEESPEWVEKRKKIKTFTFQRAYGAGANAISESTGMPIAEVEELIKNEIEMYPKVEQHFNDVKVLAERNKRHSKIVDCEVGYYTSLTSRAYHYKEYENDWGKKLSPTQLRNYDIQGGATGDLVPAYLHHLYVKLMNSKHKDKIKLINTVHDSILLDIHNDILYGVCQGLKRDLEDVSVLQNSFGITFDIPLRVDVEYGSDWMNMKSFRPEDFKSTQTNR
jgi:DNA polymerase I-like protein with 3'-5' exonuclease and polymerase domains